jgi:Amt family ammonium transporter
MIGASMLWVGWFGFNGGSALVAGQNAGMAIMVTHIAAAVGALVWMVAEWLRFGRPSLVGIATGMVAGLATVTPASGFIGIPGGLILGFGGGLVCYFAVDLIRGKLNIDDSLDVFAVHGVGGILGSLMVAVLATEGFSGAGLVGRFHGRAVHGSADLRCHYLYLDRCCQFRHSQAGGGFCSAPGIKRG